MNNQQRNPEKDYLDGFMKGWQGFIYRNRAKYPDYERIKFNMNGIVWLVTANLVFICILLLLHILQPS